MRVIAGIYRGRRLKAVPGKTARPTTDKVKEAIFQVIGPYFDNGSCFDLFAGSGSLGIEAISRGMESAVFVDKYPGAIHTIYENLKTLQIEHQAEVFRANAFQAIHAVAKKGIMFDLILLDPPYKKVDYSKLLREISELQIVKKHGIIYCEHDVDEQLPDNLTNFSIIKKANYGGTIGITVYRHSKQI